MTRRHTLTLSLHRPAAKRRHTATRPTFNFSEGSTIEVEPNKESYENVYRIATVISFDEHKILVEYQNSFDEEGNRRLIEHVPISSVRPALPPELGTGTCFLPGDVVDVFYKTCWWKGVVARVVGGAGKYVVAVGEEEREFEVADVRGHWDWLDGTWVRFAKQESGPLETQVSLPKRKRGRPPKKRKRNLRTSLQALDQQSDVLKIAENGVSSVDGLSAHETDQNILALEWTDAAFGGSSSYAEHNSKGVLDHQISLDNDERSRIQKEKLTIENEVMKLHEKMSSAQKVKDNEESQIAILEADLMKAKEGLQNLENEFQSLASSVLSNL